LYPRAIDAHAVNSCGIDSSSNRSRNIAIYTSKLTFIVGWYFWKLSRQLLC